MIVLPNNMILLETIALTQSAASVTFDNLPTSGYTDLKVVISARGTTSNINDLMKIQFNGSTANFTTRWIQGNSSTASSGNDTTGRIGYMPDAASTTSTFGNTEIYIPNYRGSANKSYSTDAVQENNSGVAGEALVNLFAGLWSQTAAISSVTLTGTNGNFAANSTFSLYGIAALGTTPVLAPKANGGNRIENDGTYWIHTFTSSGTFIPQVGLTCDVLVVAGGGGGGRYRGGGGGAGGLVYSTGEGLTVNNYSITIGAGGAGAPGGGGGNQGLSGSNSVFNSYTATGGGGGGGFANSALKNGLNGGSGGGAGEYAGSGTVGTSTQTSYSGKGFGNSGGLADIGTGAGGGGGGAGAVGSNASGANGGNGGAGKTYSISGTSTGYAGGGGGGNAGGTNGSATDGGGSGSAGNGTANTGGGGSGEPIGGSAPGNGGSGIVIIRYPIN